MVRKIRAKLVLQLRPEGLSGRAIAASQGMSRRSTTAVLEAADAAGVVWDDHVPDPLTSHGRLQPSSTWD